jgi:WD40 repeat protein
MRGGFSKVLEDNAQSFDQVRFSPNGRCIAAANDDGMLRIWNARTGQLIQKWAAHEIFFRAVMFMSDGKTLVTGGWDNEVKRWDISLIEQVELGRFRMQDDKVNEILKRNDRVCIHLLQFFSFSAHFFSRLTG